MKWKQHGYKVGAHQKWFDDADVPSEADALDDFAIKARKQIEPWLSALCQSDHLILLLGSGFTKSIANLAGATATDMARLSFGTKYDASIDAHAEASAKQMGRGAPNLEDQLRSALSLLEGLKVIGKSVASDTESVKNAIDTQMLDFLTSLLETEAGISKGNTEKERTTAAVHLQSFLLSFASRAASRERLQIVTTNYDRLVEHGCDLSGLRIIDRFVGSLTPIFRSSRIEVDMHYSPPGIRGEPRFLEGVLRLTKLHGSLDWYYDAVEKQIRRKSIPFGAPAAHSDIPKQLSDTIMIYPNPAKDVETTVYPYAELFRDFAAALCRPNSVLLTYGYGFGDDHINRIIGDMLTIPSTHLAIIAYDAAERLKVFCEMVGREAQISILIGSHFADIRNLVGYYLPKPALDFVTGRLTELLKRRPEEKQEGYPEQDDCEPGDTPRAVEKEEA